ncbi:cobalamin-binding protein [Cellvibrio japonicus]|uniref:Periplasmic binding protein n=1 Tax=Cellvibrio japonicus (strain Ueda107) TaxID=498211 RepID=B3PIN5_CELJU|nr:cobalamin-binding protein [Cellvibrio japonicus]ACE82739.1 Periplasmic binding protein [Cellvibrio japonicus Ueda107]
MRTTPMSFIRPLNMLCLLSLAFSTAGYAAPIADRQPEVSQDIVVTDARGKVIRLSKPAQTIIALAPHIVENVYSAGAGDKLIAAVNYSNYPAAALKLPQVGGYNAINYEEVLARKPDLVLGWISGNGPQVAAQLERLGMTVYVDELRTLDDIADEVMTIGKLAGTEAIANQRAHQWQQQLNQLRERYSNAKTVSVFYQVWNSPLQTLNGQHLVSDVMKLCGGENIFADALSIAPKINEESVISRNPDAIIASGMGEERPEWLDTWKQYPKLTAVQQQNLFFIPPDIIQRHTLRILDGARLMCEYLQTAREK